MCKLLMMLVCCALFSIPALADPITVAYSTAGTGPFTFEADNFSLTGQTGFLTLDTVSSTTTNINTAVFFTGDSGSFIGTQTFTLTYDLTLDGVTQSVTQMATWTITPPLDSFVTVAASSPVLFDTPAGRWNVTLWGHTPLPQSPRTSAPRESRQRRRILQYPNPARLHCSPLAC